MSAAALPIYNMLVAKGMSEKDARETAEAAEAVAAFDPNILKSAIVEALRETVPPSRGCPQPCET